MNRAGESPAYSPRSAQACPAYVTVIPTQSENSRPYPSESSKPLKVSDLFWAACDVWRASWSMQKSTQW